MITFKAIIIPGNRRKDGTYPVNIRVTFKGKSRRLPTTLVCTQADLTRSLRIKNPTILNKSDALIARMRDAVKDLSPFDLESQDVDWVVSHIKDTLTKETFRLDFFAWSDTFLQSKGKATADKYRSAVNSFGRFLGKRSIDINDISRPLLMEFSDAVAGQNKIHYDSRTGTYTESGKSKAGRGTSSRYLDKLEHIYNAAKDRYNDEDTGRILIPKSPFNKIPREYPPSAGQVNLGRDLMQRVISYRTDNATMRTALDIFIVSFGLMGVNIADLYNAKEFTGDLWTYHRQKTDVEMVLRIPDQLRPFLDRLKGTGGWWLSLHGFANNKNQVIRKVNRYLSRWCVENGVDVFTSYAARHTWASLARGLGIDKSTVDDGLAHKGDYQVADIYAEKAWDVIADANRRVLDLFDW